MKAQYRFFVRPECIRGGQVEFPHALSGQMARVLRLSEGDEVTVLDGTGMEYGVILSPSLATGLVTCRRQNEAEAPIGVHLFVALLKSRRMEIVLQKCTEVGVSAFTPIRSARCISTSDRLPRERYETIVREAAEQSGRGCLPVIHDTIDLTRAVEAASPAVMLTGNAPIRFDEALRASPRAEVRLFIGPEGGFADEEITQAARVGMVAASLGPRTLRAETAAIAASALVLLGPGAGEASDER